MLYKLCTDGQSGIYDHVLYKNLLVDLLSKSKTYRLKGAIFNFVDFFYSLCSRINNGKFKRFNSKWRS